MLSLKTCHFGKMEVIVQKMTFTNSHFHHLEWLTVQATKPNEVNLSMKLKFHFVFLSAFFVSIIVSPEVWDAPFPQSLML